MVFEIALALYFLGKKGANGTDHSGVTVQAEQAQIPSENGEPRSDAAPLALPIASAEEQSNETISAATPQTTDDLAGGEGAKEGQTDPQQTKPESYEREYGQAIEEATSIALESGRPQQWNADGAKGYVVPTLSEVVDGRRCQNAYTTMTSGERQLKYPSVRWCRSGVGGRWVEDVADR